MSYSITLILKKGQNNEPLTELKKYIEEKEGKILNISELGDANLKPGKKVEASIITKLEIEIKPDAVGKIKNKIDHEKEIVSYILEKKKIISEKKVTQEKKDKKFKKMRVPSSSLDNKDKLKKEPKSKKEDANKAKKVLASMQEEEKKIKDLNSTLDKILNE